MKKNNTPATETALKNIGKKAPVQYKVRENTPESSILADEKPIVPDQNANGPFKNQDEFIDRSSNNKQKS